MKIKDLIKIIRKGESERVEFKPSLSQINDIIQTISGFANSSGGNILIGVSNSGEVIGCDIGKDSIERLTNSINQNIEPKIYPEIFVEEIGCKQIICVNVLEVMDKPILAFGKLYKRVGKSTVLASRNEFEKLVLEKHKEKIQFDNQICEGASLKDIDKETIEKFVELAQNSKRLNGKKDSISNLIEKLGLSKNKELKNSAILLFGKEPKKFFRNNIIKCGRFRGEEKEEFIDLKDFEGNLFENLESGINFIKEHLRMSAKIEGISRKEQWEIPLEVFREALINAMIHRDYNSSGFIYIKIYDKKIIISNPGELPVELKINDLYKEHESFPRNPLLAETFYYTGFIDVWGRGSLNIIMALKERGLENPLFEQSGGYFRVIFNRVEKLNGGVNGGVNLLDYIHKNPGKRTSQMENEIKIAKRTIERKLKKLKEEGKIEFRGSAKNGGYYIKNEN